MRQAARSLLAAAAGAAAGHYGLRAARAKARARATSGGVLAAERWDRVNHRGEPVTLLEGPVYAAAAAVGVLAAPGLPGRMRAAGLVAALGAGAFGVYDDLCGSADRRGLKGHINALMQQGEVTTGAVKLAGIGGVGVLGGCLVRRGGPLTDKALAAVLIAGAANAANLLDLRPGRAIKGAAFAAVPGVLRRAAFDGPSAGAGVGAANTLAFAGLGAAAALLPEDLGERAMLGDAGANALGALFGTAAAAGARTSTGLAWRAAAMTALTVASEKVSFSKVIAGNPTLDAIDRWGRRPPAPRLPAQASAADAEHAAAEHAAAEHDAAEHAADAVAAAETAETAGSSRRPSPEEPAASSENPVASAEDLVPSPENPVPSAENPESPLENLMPSTESSGPSSEEPAPSPENPVLSAENSTSPSENPLPSTESSVPSAESSAPSSEEPAESPEKPVPSAENPVLSPENPVPFPENPMPFAENPGTLPEKTLPENSVPSADGPAATEPDTRA